MEAELARALDACEAEVLAFVEPLEQVRYGGSRCGRAGGGGGEARGRGGRGEVRGRERECDASDPRPVMNHRLRRHLWVSPDLVLANARHLPTRPAPPRTHTHTLTHRPAPPQLTAAEVRRLEAAERGRGELVVSLDELKQRVANVE